MKEKTAAIYLTLSAIVLCCMLISSKLGSLDIASLASAASIYYDIKVKLIWDQLYNLDLFVTEPDGEIASRHNTVTINGGEIGYYDQSTGEWAYGDSGNNTAPEIYRIENAPEGTYKIDVYCPGTCSGDTTTEALIYVTLYEESSLAENSTFPQTGTQTIDLTQEGWWNAGSFIFNLPDTSSGCFIATVAYGSPFAFQVLCLSDFRDKYLMNNNAGKRFVELYYKFSPPCANFIAGKPFLKKIIRMHLTPLVFAVRFLTINEE